MAEIIDKFGYGIKTDIQKEAGFPGSAIVTLSVPDSKRRIQGDLEYIRFKEHLSHVDFSAKHLSRMPDIPERLAPGDPTRHTRQLYMATEKKSTLRMTKWELTKLAKALWIGRAEN